MIHSFKCSQGRKFKTVSALNEKSGLLIPLSTILADSADL